MKIYVQIIKQCVFNLFRTNRDQEYQKMKNSDRLSMPNKQYVNDKIQVGKLMIQPESMAMYDLYTTNR